MEANSNLRPDLSWEREELIRVLEVLERSVEHIPSADATTSVDIPKKDRVVLEGGRRGRV